MQHRKSSWSDDESKHETRTSTNSHNDGPASDLYTVRSGDDLRSIAARFYGRSDLWVFIFAANPGEIHGIRELPPGKVLRIPVLD